MTTTDLIKLAPEYALQALDPQQDAAFVEALGRAPRHVQALVWDVITRTLDGLSGTLPAVQPTPALRPRTLGRVAAEIAGERAGSASEAHSPSSIVGRIAPPRRTVHPLWRAGAIGAAAAAVIFGFTTLRMQDDFKRLNSAINSNELAGLFARDFGPGFEDAFYSASSRFVQFQAPAGSRAMAVMILDDGRQTGRLFCRDLPESPTGSYQLALVDAQGRVARAVLTFSAPNHRAIEMIQELPTPGADQRLAILPTGEGAVALLTSISL